MVLIPIAALYAYFSQTSLEVIDGQIEASNESRLQFLKSQIESSAERLSLSSSVLARDSSILDLLRSTLMEDYYGMINDQNQVKEKLYLQSFSSNWTNDLSVYLPGAQWIVSTNPNDRYDAAVLESAEVGRWQYRESEPNETPYYQMFLWDSYLTQQDPLAVDAVFEVRFSLSNIRKMLQYHNQENAGHTFLLTSSGEVVSTTEETDDDLAKVGAILLDEGLDESGHRSLKLQGEQAYLTHAKLPALDAYLIDYVPLNVVHAPIIESRNFFYLGAAILVVLGFAASYMLYLHVQKPISYIVKGLKHFEMGDYGFRIEKRYHNEFDYMMLRFNDMGHEIQHLIQNVYEEQNRSRLATLKQLQSQINPHFLYNCLSFIAASAKSGDTDSIKQMAFHLGDYYRYTTRVENQMPRLREELELVEHYLHIYALRLENIGFTIDIPQEMMEEPIMRLILQPVVENAIEHGIEPNPGRGEIRITGSKEGGFNVVRVEDNGQGMTPEAIEQFHKSLALPMDERSGCGLWNVNQRLAQRFGPESGIVLGPSAQGTGLCVTLKWKSIHDMEGEAR